MKSTDWVLLINPPDFLEEDFNRRNVVMPPVSLMRLGAVVEQEGLSAVILDMALRERTEQALSAERGADKPLSRSMAELSLLLAQPGLRLVGVSNHTARTMRVVQLIVRLVKGTCPQVPIVLGGVNSTFSFEFLFETISEIDYIVRGYAEESLRSMLRLPTKDWQDIRGIAFRKPDGDSGYTREASVNVSLIPPPAIHLAQNLNGHQTGPRYSDFCRGIWPLSTEYGCDYNCSFCTSVLQGFHRRPAYIPIEVIRQEIQSAIDDGYKSFFMTANTFTSSKSQVTQVCEALVTEAERRVRWSCMTRVDACDDEDTLALMSRAGCTDISFGVETVDPLALRRYAKGVSEEYRLQIQETFKAVVAAGMAPSAFVMLGGPEDTADALAATLDFLVELRRTGLLRRAVLNPFMPWPGTPYFKSPEKFGLTIQRPTSQWGYQGGPVCSTRNLSLEEVVRWISLYDDALNSDIDEQWEGVIH